MADPTPQAPASFPDSRSRAAGLADTAKTLWETLWLPVVIFFGFCLCYALPFHAPAPHDIKVAVAGSVDASQISAGLQQGTVDPFTPLTASVTAGASSVTLP